MIIPFDECPQEINSTVPEGYEGHCKLLLKGGFRAETFAVFPNFKEAESAAHAALNPTVSGYGHVKIEMTTGDVTHESVHDWIAED